MHITMHHVVIADLVALALAATPALIRPLDRGVHRRAPSVADRIRERMTVRPGAFS
jgi:hypothetical protein